jgi:hypothetical protein
MCTVLSSRFVKRTKKRRRCVVCDQWIEIGSEAHRQVNVDADWGFCTVYWHDGCLLKVLDADDDDY